MTDLIIAGSIILLMGVIAILYALQVLQQHLVDIYKVLEGIHTELLQHNNREHQRRLRAFFQELEQERNK